MLNIEYRTRNFEFRSVASLAQRKRLRRVSLCLFISIIMTEYLTSAFIIQNSIFDISILVDRKSTNFRIKSLKGNSTFRH
jgi:hypothetical protein